MPMLVSHSDFDYPIPMARVLYRCRPTRLFPARAGDYRRGQCPRPHTVLALALLGWLTLLGTNRSQAVILWSQPNPVLVHETGAGTNILGGGLKRDNRSTDCLYFRFHVDPLSDATTEEYFAAFQLYEGQKERLAMGNALRAYAYTAFALDETRPAEYVDLNSSIPEPSGPDTFFAYEVPHRGIERTLVFKVEYAAGGDDRVTVWLDPDLGPGATETNQPASLITRFQAQASFDQVRLRQGGGGEGWIFSEMAIATSFDDLLNTPSLGANSTAARGFVRGEEPFTFSSWQREQGLPQNFVRALAQTRDGYLWVGTDDGVSRFDGVRFVSFGLQEGFHGGPVQALLGDSRGALWIGSIGGGLGRWQGGVLRTFTVTDGLPSSTITALAEGKDGRLWIGTQAGLAVWEQGKLKPPEGAGELAGKSIAAIFAGAQGTVWVAVEGTGIFFQQGHGFHQLREPQLDGLLRNPHCVLVDRAGRLWIGAGDAFLLCRDAHGWHTYDIPRHFGGHYIGALAEEADGTVWAGSVSEGLFHFKDGRLEAINAGSGLSDNLVEALLVDREGKLWVGTHGGLNRIRLRTVVALSHNQGLGYGAVQALAEVGPGVVWAAKPSEGIYSWDGHRFRRLMLAGLPRQDPRVAALLAGPDGSCWVGGAFGLLQFEQPRLAERTGPRTVLTNVNVSALACDGKDGVWAGTRDGKLWHRQSGQWQAQALSQPGHAITALVPSPDGTLWVGTEGDGLYQCQQGAPGHWEKCTNLPSAWVSTLYLDGQGTLWVGTAGGGLGRLQGRRMATVTTRDGLLDNSISQILEDDEGCLWLGGTRGIVRASKHDLDQLAAHRLAAIYPQVYGQAEGMLSEECSAGFFPAGLKTKAGLLWFSTLKGVVVLDPRHCVSAPPPIVAVEETWVDGVQVHPRAGSDPLQVGPGKSRLEFRFTGLSFDAPERVRFRYRLEGLDSDWVDAGTRRTAFYGFVPPGAYRFQVMACNGDGVWSEADASLALRVVPYFWQTWWFLGAAGLGTVVAGAGCARLVEKRKHARRLKRLEQERALEQERTRIAQDLHDTMGAKLCRISFLSEHARRCADAPAGIRQELAAMSDDSREVLQSLDIIVWAVNPQNDTLEHLAIYVAQYAREYFNRTGIECELEVPASLPARPVSSQSRHHLFMAVREALTNILKHSGAGRAKLSMACRNGAFELTISDNGIGMDPASAQNGGGDAAAGFANGLANMRSRLTTVGGRFELESRPGHGTTLRFELPLAGF
jgi:ligand-binding sensor domain-containing protein/signal transduction histidine kinase